MPKVTNISMYEAVNIDSIPENTAIISINEEHEDLYPLKIGGKLVHKLQFTDTVLDFKYCNKTYRPISHKDVNQLLDFILEHRDKDFIVHCAAGVSRSAGVALAINHILGHDLKEHFWNLSEPNSYVYGTMIIEYLKRNL